jgi:hypothetical protein
MIRILYVHGYNGKPNGESFQKLAKYAEVADFGGEFNGNESTGICPYCMIDSVLADADWKDLSPEFLEKMRKFFFS